MSPQDWLNAVCFAITTIVAIAGIWIAKKVKLPCWKLQAVWIGMHEIIAIALLVSRLR